MQQKKLLAVAVASAFGVPALAHAQTSKVEIFGKAYVEYSFVDQGRGAAGDRNNVDMLQTPGSEIGIKGEEKLGGGVSAWFRCTSTADFRGQSPEGFCSRNSALGLKGAFGNIFIGKWDTPFKRTAAPNLIVNQTGVFGASFILMGASGGVTGRDNPGRWLRRQSNSINYDSPNFNGFQILAATNATNDATNTTTAQSGAKARLWSLGGQYSNGPLYVSGAYEQHRNFYPGGTAVSGTDNGWHIGAHYTFGGNVKVAGLYTRQKFEQGAGFDSRVDAWHLAVDWHISGPHGLRAGYTQSGDVKGTLGAAPVNGGGSTRPSPGSDTGAKLWQISYVHTFSKRTEGTIGYVQLDNDNNAFYSLGGLKSPVNGENQHAFALTMKHRF